MTAVVRGESVDLIVTSPPRDRPQRLEEHKRSGSGGPGRRGSRTSTRPTSASAPTATTASTSPASSAPSLTRARLVAKRDPERVYDERAHWPPRECWRVLKPCVDGTPIPGQARSCTSGTDAGSTLQGTTLQGTTQQRARVQGERSGGLNGYTKAAFGRAKSKQLLPHRYAIGVEDGLADPDGIGWIVRHDLVWDKPNGLPESVRDRARDSHEYWFHLTRDGDYFAAIDEIREPYAPGSADRCAAGFAGDRRAQNGANAGHLRVEEGWGNGYEVNPRGKLPGSVWRIATEPLKVPEHLQVDHFAAFPIEWPRRLVLAFSPAGGVVLDPFGGTGTTAMVARALGRTGVSLDLSSDYCRLARWRVFDSPGAGKVADRTAGERQGALL